MRVTLADIQRKYEDIMECPEGAIRDRLLSDLMDFVKAEYKIPLMQDVEWEHKNKAIIAMYRKISISRTTI